MRTGTTTKTAHALNTERTYQVGKATASYLQAIEHLDEANNNLLDAVELCYGENYVFAKVYLDKVEEARRELFRLFEEHIEAQLATIDNIRGKVVEI